MITNLVNRTWLLSQHRLSQKFLNNASNCRGIQEAILLNYLSDNANTEYGKKHQFKKIKSYQEYSQTVPIIEDYSQIQGYVEEMMSGKQHVLFPGKALFFESTSGSSSMAKIIPYNKRFKKELKAAIAAWMWDLNKLDKQIFSGKAYWSLSPPLKPQSATQSGLRIGANNDADYFDPFSALLLRQILVLPAELHRISDPYEFYLQTWKHLLDSSNLSFMSIWSPQFLLKLFDFFKDNFKEICVVANLKTSTIDLIKAAITENRLTLEVLFPNLRMISCWTNAQSAIWINQLNAVVGNIPLQGKGLLSTEGVVTIPMAMDKHVLSYTSHFYEFKDETGAIYPAESLVPEGIYEVIITTGAGLYRYNTHDLVKCTGHFHTVPCLEFLGRSGNISDLVGEKLSEISLNEVFIKTQEKYKEAEALFLFPYKRENRAGYKLIIAGNINGKGNAISAFVEKQLSENPYYTQGLASGQLHELSYIEVEKEFTIKLLKHYQADKNISDGDIKLPLLYPLGYLDKLIDTEA